MNGALIRQRREAKGLSQRDLAELVDIPQSYISRLESGSRQSTSIATLRRLAAVLEVSIEDLLRDPTPPPAALAEPAV